MRFAQSNFRREGHPRHAAELELATPQAFVRLVAFERVSRATALRNGSNDSDLQGGRPREQQGGQGTKDWDGKAEFLRRDHFVQISARKGCAAECYCIFGSRIVHLSPRLGNAGESGDVCVKSPDLSHLHVDASASAQISASDFTL